MRLKIVQISWKIVFRKKTRAILTILSISLAVLFSMFFSGLQQGYSNSISQDIQNVGAHILAIPKGCPYEATATLLHGGILPKQLPEETLDRIEGIDNVRSAYSTLIGILPSIQAKETE
jgi:ABC-type lipoprotein release transport system permease subunit